MVELNLIKEEYPVWSVKNFDIPNLNLTGHTEDNAREALLSINEKRKPSRLSKDNPLHQEFADAWTRNTNDIMSWLKDDEFISKVPEIKHMWPRGFSSFEWPDPFMTVDIIKDSSGFSMEPHVDNREVVGVLIVNLQDNPRGTGTKFTMIQSPEPWKEPRTWYMGPEKKGTGVFFLNNWNSWHRIENTTGQTRCIGYEVMHINGFNW